MPDERQRWVVEPCAALGDSHPSTAQSPQEPPVLPPAQSSRIVPVPREGVREPDGDVLLGCNPPQVLCYLLAS